MVFPVTDFFVFLEMTYIETPRRWYLWYLLLIDWMIDTVDYHCDTIVTLNCNSLSLTYSYILYHSKISFQKSQQHTNSWIKSRFGPEAFQGNVASTRNLGSFACIISILDVCICLQRFATSAHWESRSCGSNRNFWFCTFFILFLCTLFFFGAAKKHSSTLVVGFCTYEEVYLQFLWELICSTFQVFQNITSISCWKLPRTWSKRLWICFTPESKAVKQRCMFLSFIWIRKQ